MTAHAVLMVFTLCSATMDPAVGRHDCEQGEIRARTCAAAKRVIRNAMRPGMTLHVQSCEEAP